MTLIDSNASRRSCLRVGRRSEHCLRRNGKVLVLLAILMPALFGIVGLVLDGGLMMDEHRQLQHSTDAAATAAAMDLRQGKSSAVATSTATNLILIGNELPDAAVTVNIPPASGPYAGQPAHVEVIAGRNYESRFMRILNGIVDHSMQARTVAGVEDATADAAIVVLDPDPADLSYPSSGEVAAAIDQTDLTDDAVSQSGAAELLSPVPVVGAIAANLVNTEIADLLPDVVADLLNDVIANALTTALPTLTAGLEIEGIGQLVVDGSILVNNEWGGVDEDGEPAGSAPGPPYGVACMPILSTTEVLARDIRVVGGVDDENNYGPFASGDPNPLQANRLPVPDPFQSLPAPSTASDSSNVDSTVHDPADLVRIAIPATDAAQLANDVLNQLPVLLRPLFQPLIAPLIELLTQPVIEPGVYNSITVLSPAGGARFEPGVYIIRGTSPDTNMSLCILGPVEADGVLFYITNSASYDPSTGFPDAGDDPDVPPANPVPSQVPSTLIAPLLTGAHFSGLNDPGSPYNGILIFQRRNDRRPIVIEAQQLVGSGDISGTVYAKWGHTVFAAGAGSYNLRFVSGTLRVVTVTDTTIAPTNLLPPAEDVLLLE